MLDDAKILAHERKLQNKAEVKKAMQEVERRILAPLRHQQFTNFTDLNAAIREYLSKRNGHTMKGYSLFHVALFERTDQLELKLLPAYPFIFAI